MNDISFHELYGDDSFGGGGSSRGSRGRKERRANRGQAAAQTQAAIVDTMGDALVGDPGDNPDMGAMSDSNRAINSRVRIVMSGGGGGGGRGGGGR